MQGTQDRKNRQWPANFFTSVGRRLHWLRIEQDAGIHEIAALELPLDIQYACFHRTLALLYVVCSNGGVARRGDRHCLVQLAYDGGALRPVAEPIALPYRPLHASVDPRLQQLALAYNLPAAVSFHALDAQGRVQPSCSLLEGAGRVGHFPHQIIPFPREHQWLVTARGDDATPARRENPGSLRVLEHTHGAAEGRQLVAPRAGYGFGPRNCGFHPRLPVLYAVLERQNRLAAFRCDHGVIEAQPRWSAELLERPPPAGVPQLAGAIVVHPNGRQAFVVNRSHPGAAAACGDNSLVVFALDGQTGEPRELQRVRLEGLHARCLSLSPDGRMLVAAMRQPGVIAHPQRGQVDVDAGLVCLRIEATGRLLTLASHPIDVGEQQLFWADFSPLAFGA